MVAPVPVARRPSPAPSGCRAVQSGPDRSGPSVRLAPASSACRAGHSAPDRCSPSVRLAPRLPSVAGWSVLHRDRPDVTLVRTPVVRQDDATHRLAAASAPTKTAAPTVVPTTRDAERDPRLDVSGRKPTGVSSKRPRAVLHAISPLAAAVRIRASFSSAVPGKSSRSRPLPRCLSMVSIWLPALLMTGTPMITRRHILAPHWLRTPLSLGVG